MDVDSLTEMMQGFTIAKIETNTEFIKAIDMLSGDKKIQYIEKLKKEVQQLALTLEDNLKNNKSAASVDVMANLLLPILAYEHCLKIDVRKWQQMIRDRNRVVPEMPVIDMTKFVPQEKRDFPKFQKTKQHYNQDLTTLLQLAFNYWRSCYQNLPKVEALRGITNRQYEQHIWRLEQISLFYREAYNYSKVADLNECRIPEPHSVYGFEPNPLDYVTVRTSLRARHQ